MAEDRGGLQYNINVGGDWREEISDFRSQIRDVRRDADQVRRSRSARTRRVNSDELKRQAKAEDDLTKSQQLRAKALREYNKETERQAVASRKAEVAERQRFRVERRQLSALEVKRAALEKNNAASNKARVIEERYNQVLERHGRINEDIARQYGVLTEFKRRQVAVTKRLSAEEKRHQKAVEAVNRALEQQSQARATAAELSRRGVRDQLTTRQLQQLGQLSIIPPARAARRSAADDKGPESLAQRVGRLREQFRSLVPAVLTADSSVNRISFTFRRLFGILAAFAAARLAINTIRDLVRGVIEFNSNLEQSRLGIAALIAAVSDLRTPQGEIVEGAAAIALAQREANKQTALLRAEALKTAATFDQLAETFQVALAPGLQAGLALDEVRQFTVRIAQAAAAIGLEQNQLAEEIRSILSGTIQARTTRIAVALGISNADIRRVREAGTLFEFLEERFAAFEAAGNEAVTTFAAITTNLKDAFFFVTSIGTADVFRTLKEALQGIIDLLVTRDPITDNIVPSAEALRGAKELAAIFAAIVDEVRRVAGAFGIEGVVDGIRSIRAFLEPVIFLLGGVVEGVLEGFGVIRDVIRNIFEGVNALTGINVFDPDSLENIREIFKDWAKFLTVVVGLWIIFSNTILPVVTTVLGTLVSLAFRFYQFILLSKAAFASEAVIIEKFGAKWGARLVAIRATFARILGSVVRIALALFLFLEALDAAFEAATGFELKLETIGKLLRTYFAKQFEIGLVGMKRRWVQFTLFLVETLKKGASSIAALLVDPLKEAVEEYSRIIRGLAGAVQASPARFTSLGKGIAALNDIFQKESDRLVSSLDTAKRNIADRTNSLLDPAIRSLKQQEAKLNSELRGLEQEQLNLLQGILSNRDQDATFGELLGDAFRVTLAKIFGEDFVFGIPLGFEGEDALRVTAKDILADLTGVFVSARPPLEELSEEAKNFADNLQRIEDQLAIDSAARGLSGVVEQVAREAARARQTEQKTLKRLQKEQETLNKLIERSTDIRNEASGQLDDLPEREAAAAKQVQEILNRRKETVEELLENQRLGLQTEEDVVSAIKEIIELTNGELDSFIVGRDIKADTLRLILRQATAQQEIARAQFDLNQSKLDEQRLQRETNRLTLRQLELVARQSAELAKQAELDEIELKFESASLRSESLPEFQARAVVAKAELDRAKELANVRQRQFRTDFDNLNNRISLLRASVAAQQEYNAALLASPDLNDEERTSILEEEQHDLRSIAQLEDLRNQLVNKHAIAQARAGAEIESLKQKHDDATNLMRINIRDVEGALEQFSTTAAGALVDAFDPSKAVDFRNVLADFFASIAKQLLDLIIRAILLRTILSSLGSIGLGFSSGGPTPAPAGFARGGRVRGFARGGSVGALDPRDRIPAMLRVGEYVIRPEAVSMYGHRLLNAINTMQLDPAAIVPPSRPTKVSPSVGKATGGPVSGADRPALSQGMQQPSGGASVAVVVASDESLDLMLRGGKTAFLKFLAEYRGEINGQLGR